MKIFLYFALCSCYNKEPAESQRLKEVLYAEETSSDLEVRI